MLQASSLRLPAREAESSVGSFAGRGSRGTDGTPSAAGSSNVAVSVQYDAAKRRRVCEEEEEVGGAASKAPRVGHDSTADAVACEEASDDEQDQVESDDGLTLRSSDEAPKGHRCRYCDYRAAGRAL